MAAEMADYGIGSEKWPGLAKVIEEGSEVLTVAAKIMAVDGEHEYFDDTDLVQWLEEEIGDLMAAVTFLIIHNDALDIDRITVRATQKGRLFEEWHRRTT